MSNTTKSTDTAAPTATTSTSKTSKPAKAKTTAAKKAKPTPAEALEKILRGGWSSTLRAAASDIKAGGDLGDIARQLVRLADDIKAAAKVVSA